MFGASKFKINKSFLWINKINLKIKNKIDFKNTWYSKSATLKKLLNYIKILKIWRGGNKGKKIPSKLHFKFYLLPN